MKDQKMFHDGPNQVAALSGEESGRVERLNTYLDFKNRQTFP